MCTIFHILIQSRALAGENSQATKSNMFRATAAAAFLRLIQNLLGFLDQKPNNAFFLPSLISSSRDSFHLLRNIIATFTNSLHFEVADLLCFKVTTTTELVISLIFRVNLVSSDGFTLTWARLLLQKTAQIVCLALLGWNWNGISIASLSDAEENFPLKFPRFWKIIII